MKELLVKPKITDKRWILQKLKSQKKLSCFLLRLEWPPELKFKLVLIIYCCQQITPKIGSLKQYTFISHSFCGWGSECGVARYLAQGLSQKHRQGVGWGCSPLKAQMGGDPLPRWLLADFRSSLAHGRRHQFLVTWASPRSSSHHGSWLPSEGASTRTAKSLRSANIHWSHHVLHHP